MEPIKEELNPCCTFNKILCGNLLSEKDNPIDPTKKLCFCEKRRIQHTRKFFYLVSESLKYGDDFRDCEYLTSKRPIQKSLF